MYPGRSPARLGGADIIRPTVRPRTATCARRETTVTATSNAFADRVATFFDEYFRLDPVSASSIGDHRFDDRWPDMTDAGRAERLAFAERWIAELRGLDVSVLSGDELADRDVLLLELDAARFREEEL